METVAAVLGIFILACLAVAAMAVVGMVWVFAWDESGKIIRHRRQILDMERHLEKMSSDTGG